jgi:hypothetical protein
MAFSGLSFPALTYGNRIRNTKVSAMMPVAITSNGTFEYRVNRSAYTRFQWTIPAWNYDQADQKALLEFWNQVGGQLQSFLYTDPNYNAFSDATIGEGTQINPPAAPTVTTSTTGGSIAASTAMTYGVTALNAQGESTESATTSITTGSSTATNSNTITWTAVSGATSYNIYQGGKLIGNTSGTSFTDTGYPGGVAAPTVNGTGTTAYPLLVPVAGILHPIWHPSGLTVNGSTSGWSFGIQNQQPVIQYPAGSCPAYGTSVTASGSFAFAVRFSTPLTYTMLASGELQATGPAQVAALTMMEVFE